MHPKIYTYDSLSLSAEIRGDLRLIKCIETYANTRSSRACIYILERYVIRKYPLWNAIILEKYEINLARGIRFDETGLKWNVTLACELNVTSTRNDRNFITLTNQPIRREEEEFSRENSHRDRIHSVMWPELFVTRVAFTDSSRISLLCFRVYEEGSLEASVAYGH